MCNFKQKKTLDTKLGIQMESLEAKMESLNLMVPGLIIKTFILKGKIVILTKSVHLVPLLTLLKLHENFQYDTLVDITSLDDSVNKLSFQVFYTLINKESKTKVTIMVYPNENKSMPTIENIFVNASLFERGIWDKSRIVFKGIGV